MSSRTLALLLLAFNLGAAAWLWRERSTPPLPVADPGVAALVLLSERDAGEDGAELADAPESLADLAGDQCRSLGPFATRADLRAATSALAPRVKRLRGREERVTQMRGNWVYLPAVASREQALATARQLSAKGVRDYYIVTAGDQQNTISLGLFRDPANAERRAAAISALGFAPKTEARSEEVPVYWLDYALQDEAELDWRAMVANAAELGEAKIECR